MDNIKLDSYQFHIEYLPTTFSKLNIYVWLHLTYLYIRLFSVPMPRHKSHLSLLNVFLRHYRGQGKTAVEQEAGEKIDFKR